MAQQLNLFNSPQTHLTSDDYYTPKWIFDTLDIYFDIDVAAPDDGPVHTPCKHYYTKETDGLLQNWTGNIFMNPPFSKIQPWINKFINHGNGIALVPFSKSRWFDQIWNSQIAITSLPQSLKYEDPKGGNGSIFMPSMMIAMNQSNIQALSKIGRIR